MAFAPSLHADECTSKVASRESSRRRVAYRWAEGQYDRLQVVAAPDLDGLRATRQLPTAAITDSHTVQGLERALAPIDSEITTGAFGRPSAKPE